MTKDAGPPIVIVGAGAIGVGLAVACRGEGRRVTLLGRAGALGRARLNVSAEAFEAEFEPAPGEEAVVVVAVKDYDLEGVAERFKGVLGGAAAIVALQNGLGSAERLGHGERVVRAITWACARRTSMAEASWAGPIRLAVETHSDSGTLPALAGGRLAGQLVRVEYVEPGEFRALQFEKLVVNVTANTLAARYGLNCAGLLRHDEASRAAAVIAREVASLARAHGADLREDAESIVRRAWTQMGEFEPSMLQDARAGRPLELRSIVDEPLAEAARSNVPMPALSTLRDALRRQFPRRPSSER